MFPNNCFLHNQNLVFLYKDTINQQMLFYIMAKMETILNSDWH